jgi:hypothetical protein
MTWKKVKRIHKKLQIPVQKFEIFSRYALWYLIMPIKEGPAWVSPFGPIKKGHSLVPFFKKQSQVE